VWALNKRKPWFHLLFETARGFLPPALVGVPKHKRPAPWLNPDFVKRNRAALQGYESRLKVFGPLPSFQENVSTLAALQRQLGCDVLPSVPAYDKRYPYLDRGLLEFMYSVPREQLVRPGHRRSLMRRALVGIVPSELLNRKRNAFVARGPMVAVATEWASLTELSQQMVRSSLRVVDKQRISEALQKARQGQEVAMVPLIRTLAVEAWVRHLSNSGILVGTDEATRNSLRSLTPTVISAEKSQSGKEVINDEIRKAGSCCVDARHFGDSRRSPKAIDWHL